MSKIINKKEMYRLLIAGVLGNTLRQWATIDDMQSSGYRGYFAIRSHKPGGEFKPNLLSYANAQWSLYDYYIRNKCGKKDVTLSEMEDKSNTKVFSAEIGYVNGLLVIRYSTSQALFRDAMKCSSYLSGVSARTFLLVNLDRCDYDELDILMECYDTAIFEITCYQRPIGVMSKRMVVWEGRDY